MSNVCSKHVESCK